MRCLIMVAPGWRRASVVVAGNSVEVLVEVGMLDGLSGLAV